MRKKQIVIFWRKIINLFNKKPANISNISNTQNIIDLLEEDTPEHDTEKYEISPHERASILLAEDPELYKAVLDHYEELIWGRMKRATIFEERLLKKESKNWLHKVVGPMNL